MLDRINQNISAAKSLNKTGKHEEAKDLLMSTIAMHADMVSESKEMLSESALNLGLSLKLKLAETYLDLREYTKTEELLENYTYTEKQLEILPIEAIKLYGEINHCLGRLNYLTEVSGQDIIHYSRALYLIKKTGNPEEMKDEDLRERLPYYFDFATSLDRDKDTNQEITIRSDGITLINLIKNKSEEDFRNLAMQYHNLAICYKKVHDIEAQSKNSLLAIKNWRLIKNKSGADYAIIAKVAFDLDEYLPMLFWSKTYKINTFIQHYNKTSDEVYNGPNEREKAFYLLLMMEIIFKEYANENFPLEEIKTYLQDDKQLKHFKKLLDSLKHKYESMKSLISGSESVVIALAALINKNEQVLQGLKHDQFKMKHQLRQLQDGLAETQRKVISLREAQKEEKPDKPKPSKKPKLGLFESKEDLSVSPYQNLRNKRKRT